MYGGRRHETKQKDTVRGKIGTKGLKIGVKGLMRGRGRRKRKEEGGGTRPICD